MALLRLSGSFSRVSEFSRGVPALERLRLAVFQDELEDDVGELRDPELQALVRDELLFGLASEEEVEAAFKSFRREFRRAQ